MWKLALLVFLLFNWDEVKAEVTIMGGVFFGRPPETGTYWNSNNDQYVNNMTPPAFALRYDTDKRNGWSYGVQYTHFGTVRMDAMAVGADAPEPGGYIPETGGCVGPCRPLFRWRMESETKGISAIMTRHFNDWSFEGGLNIYEAKTKGNWTGHGGRYDYPNTTYLGIMPMLGGTYTDGKLSLHAQVWWMPTPGWTPAAFTEDAQMTLLVGYSFH
jgi:hypothetical protein